MRKLSPYTIASNCTDLRDLQGGIEDMRVVIKELTDRGDEIPQAYLKRLEKLLEKKAKLEQSIYLVNSGEYTSFDMSRYARTKEDAFKLGISLISESRGELIVTKPPTLVEKGMNCEYYKFSALIKGEEDFETHYEFCLQTLVMFEP